MNITIKGPLKTTTIKQENKCLISDILRNNKLTISMPCSGQHKCGKCRVKVSGAVSQITAEEKKLLGNAEEAVRLSCMTYAVGDCEITVSSDDVTVISDGFTSKIVLQPMGENYGFAVDVGTSTIAVYAYDLKTGKQICRDAFFNPQCIYGGDVISRIEASLDGKANELSDLIANSIENSLKKLCENNKIDTKLVDTVVITGNTTMLYLLMKKDVRCLSAAPFEIEDYLDKTYPADVCGINGFYNANVYLPRTMSAFVGSDITCSVLSSIDLLKTKNASIIIDIGTNGEMAILMGEHLVCCSTAAGPAFEGAGIEMGSMAMNGAINKVYIENEKLCYTTINNEKAIGICGSGLIDAIASLISIGLIDESGCIDDMNEKYSEYIIEFQDNPAIKLSNSGVIITQKDIRAVQLAKSAICAGVYSLLNTLDITVDDIDSLILAGGFGSYIDVENAGIIGLIPKQLVSKARAVGNAAGMGASAMLLSREALDIGTGLAEKSETLDLSTSSFFMEKYVDCMIFYSKN